MKSPTLKLLLLLTALSLSACDTGPVKKDTDAETEATSQGKTPTEQQASLIEEAENLLELAADSDTPTEQHKYRIQATYLYIEAGNLALAKQQLATIKQNHNAQKSPGQAQATDIQLVSAKIAVAEKDTVAAEQIISDIKPLTREQQIHYYALKADLDYMSGKYFFAVERRVQLAAYLVDDKSKIQNNRKIWAALSSMPDTQLNSQKTSKPVIQGWLELAIVMRSAQNNTDKLENKLLDWGTRHPAHPAHDGLLAELIDTYQVDLSTQKHIAVLLPLKGDLSTVTATIKNGLLSAFYNDANSKVKPVINFYNSSNENLTFQQLYQQAIDDGATDIIGPLNKVVINQLAQQSELDVPVLTLNYSENTNTITENLFQFGLAPEDEARQVADLAIRQNRKRAAVFYPDSEWGRRLNAAFTEHYEFLGGRVLTATDYATNTNDYRRPIRALFNLDQSSIRSRKVADTIGKNTQTEPRRRQDIDMIFLAATHRPARSIMPAFKFHRAGDLPVYSTSHVYTGKINRELDRDLDGLVFCDLPWVLQNNSPLASVFTHNWPQQEKFTRLFALGVDAYNLVYNLDYLQNKDYAFFAGQTGNIQLDENNRIIRKLLWAKFEKGRAVSFVPAISEAQASAAQKNKSVKNQGSPE